MATKTNANAPALPAADSAPEATPLPPRPDALLLVDGGKWGQGRAKTAAVCDYAEPILGGRVHFGKFPPRHLFVTRSPHDSYLMPMWHEHAGRERYRWEDEGDGVRYGYLVDGAPTAEEIEAGNKEAFGS